MAGTVQIDIDPDSQHLLGQLTRKLGWSPSRVVQEALRLLATCHPRPRRKIAGMGKFRSGVGNLGSSRAHLKSLGR